MYVTEVNFCVPISEIAKSVSNIYCLKRALSSALFCHIDQNQCAKMDRAVTMYTNSCSLKSKMSSIEFCELNFAFEGDLRGGQVPLEICKSYRKHLF